MSNNLSRNEEIKLEVALIKKEINEFQYNEHDIDYQFNQVVDWGVKLKHVAEKLLLMREQQEILKKARELDSKWNDIGKNPFHAFQDGDDEVEQKSYPNRRKRYRFSAEQIKAIRKSTKTHKEIARVVGCTAGLICQIKNRNIYKKV